jgi:DNA-binding response OmpR family regulator
MTGRAARKLLLIDDDVAFVESLRSLLVDEGFEVEAQTDSTVGFSRAVTGDFAMVICDITMPRLDGLTLCKRLRERGCATPLLLVTSRDSELDEALGLELGADDYISKPFHPRVLLARIHAVQRRTNAVAGTTLDPSNEIVRGDLRLRPDQYVVIVKSQSLVTTATEFRILQALVEAPGRVFSRDRLMEKSRADDTIVTGRIIDTYIARLRKKIAAVDEDIATQLETVSGVGYRWRA